MFKNIAMLFIAAVFSLNVQAQNATTRTIIENYEAEVIDTFISREEKYCSKVVAAATGATGGAAAGVAGGMMFGPIGALIGGAGGLIIGSFGGHEASCEVRVTVVRKTDGTMSELLDLRTNNAIKAGQRFRVTVRDDKTVTARELK